MQPFVNEAGGNTRYIKHTSLIVYRRSQQGHQGMDTFPVTAQGGQGSSIVDEVLEHHHLSLRWRNISCPQLPLPGRWQVLCCSNEYVRNEERFEYGTD